MTILYIILSILLGVLVVTATQMLLPRVYKVYVEAFADPEKKKYTIAMKPLERVSDLGITNVYINQKLARTNPRLPAYETFRIEITDTFGRVKKLTYELLPKGTVLRYAEKSKFSNTDDWVRIALDKDLEFFIQTLAWIRVNFFDTPSKSMAAFYSFSEKLEKPYLTSKLKEPKEILKHLVKRAEELFENPYVGSAMN